MPSPWTCETCKQLIRSGEGFIEIINKSVALGEVGIYPQEPSDDSSLGKRPNNGIIVHHRGVCDPHPENDGYWLAVERAETPEQWLNWVEHLFEKTWMSREDMERLVAFWRSNRGMPPGV